MKAEYLLYFCDGIGSVFDSQVMSLLTGIYERNEFRKIYLFLGVRNEEQENYYITSKSISEIETVFFKTYPNYPFFNSITRKNLKNALLNLDVDLNQAMIHTRGEMVAWHLIKILNSKYHKNIIPDIRGASVEELEQFYDLNYMMKSLKISNNKKACIMLNRFNNISAVTDSLKNYLITNYNIDKEKISVTPCLAGKNFRFDMSERALLRSELKIKDNDFLIVFSSGGVASWQNNDVLNSLAEKGIKVLNLSKKEILHENVINKFVSYDEMPAYLNTADAAIIWRDKSIVNKVASPVKFSEYICCGLPVIANKNVDLVNDYIQKYNAGLLIDSLDSIGFNELLNLKQMNRKKISESGISHFGLSKITNDYCQIYSSVNVL